MILLTPPEGKSDVTVRFASTDTTKHPPQPVAALGKRSSAVAQTLWFAFTALSPSTGFCYAISIKDTKRDTRSVEYSDS